MLLVYGIGLGLPFILLGLGFEKLMPILKRSQRFTHQLQKIAGLIIIFAGLLLLTGKVESFVLKAIQLLGLKGLTG